MAEDVGQLIAGGVEAAREGEYREALGALQRAVELDPGSASAHYNLGVLYGMLVLEDVEDAELFEHLGDEQVLIMNAIAEYEEAIDLAPRLVEAYENLARMYEAQGDEDEARNTLLRGLAANPQSDELRRRLEEMG